MRAGQRLATIGQCLPGLAGVSDFAICIVAGVMAQHIGRRVMRRLRRGNLLLEGCQRGLQSRDILATGLLIGNVSLRFGYDLIHPVQVLLLFVQPILLALIPTFQALVARL